MADPAIRFLLENLKEFIVYHGRLIRDAEAQANSLNLELALFKARLDDSTDTWQQGKTAKEWVNQIRAAVHQMEDAIDESVAKRGHSMKSRSFWRKAYRYVSKVPELINVAQQVTGLKTLATSIYAEGRQRFVTAGSAEQNHDQRTQDWMDPLKEDDIIGFEEDKKIICNYLREEKDELDVISIVGMPGVGKTKLARKILNDMKNEAKGGLFSIAIMVDLSLYDYSGKKVFLRMLYQIPDAVLSTETKTQKKVEDMESKELAAIVSEKLSQSQSFLVVLDNVWDSTVWNQLKAAFPTTNKAGKILITTQNEQVCVSASSSSMHKLPLLQQPESLKLLNLAAFGKNKQCPETLNQQAIVIASKCEGLPHLIVAIGDYLKTTCGHGDVGGVALQTDTWTKVSHDLTSCLDSDDDGSMKISLFSKYLLCYNSLPHNLRPCFLYLGIFPQDYKIPVAMLFQLWIAEGFIPAAKQASTPEDTADAYLRDLIRRNLVIVDELCADGRPKKCHLHFMLREFCKVEASIENENLFQDARKSSEQALPTDLRRITIDARVIDFLSSKPNGPRVRSFLYFSGEDEDKVPLGDEHISSVPAAFKWLRVFAAQPIIFKKLPTNEWIKLVHLRFVVLSINSKVIPEDFSRLWNMQTFVVYTKESTLDIKANIWKMEKLRHMKTNVPTKLPSATKGKEGKNLHTLGTILDESCTQELFTRADKLKKLGIQGKLIELFESNILMKLKKLENLKLESSIRPNSRDESWGLPRGLYLPPKLKRLSLCRTGFPWKDMAILGNLDCLQILKLKDGAFIGDIWAVNNYSFPGLLVLHIENTNLCTWSLHGDKQFPNLQHLFLWKCERLKQFPLGQMKEIKRLNLESVSDSVYAITEACGWKKKQNKAGEGTAQKGQEFCQGTGV